MNSGKSTGSKPTNNSSIMRYAGLATQWLVMLLLAVWCGYKIDQAIGWSVPVFLVVLPLVALAVSLWKLIKEFNSPGK